MSIRRVATAASTGLFTFLLCMAIAIAGVMLVLNSPAKAENAIRQSGFYGALVAGIIRENQQPQSDQHTIEDPLDTIPLNDATVQAAIQKAFPPELLQAQTDKLIGSLYPWLEGQAMVPDFHIDLTAAKTAFAQNVGTIVQQRLNALPICTITPAETIDPFGATCSPGADNIPIISQQVIQAVATSNNFLPSTVLTATTFTGSNGQPLFQQLHTLPGYYQTALRLPYIFAGLAILAGVLTLTGSADRRGAIRRLSLIVIGSGLFFIITAALFNSLFQHFTDSFGSEQGSSFFTQQFTQIVNQASKAVDREYLLLGGLCIALGVMVLFIARLLHFRFTPQAQQVSL